MLEETSKQSRRVLPAQPPVCYNCRMPGHIRANCPRSQQDFRRGVASGGAKTPYGRAERRTIHYGLFPTPTTTRAPASKRLRANFTGYSTRLSPRFVWNGVRYVAVSTSTPKESLFVSQPVRQKLMTSHTLNTPKQSLFVSQPVRSRSVERLKRNSEECARKGRKRKSKFTIFRNSKTHYNHYSHQSNRACFQKEAANGWYTN